MNYDNYKLASPDSYFDKEVETCPCELCSDEVSVDNKYEIGDFKCLCADCFNYEINK